LQHLPPHVNASLGAERVGVAASEGTRSAEPHQVALCRGGALGRDGKLAA